MKKLHFGCGHIKLDGYINVDIRKLPHVDVVTDVSKSLPFENDSIDEILANSVLEHLPHNSTKGNPATPFFNTVEVLKEWRRVLKPEGLLSIRVPNLEGICRQYYNNNMTVRDFITYLYGGQEYPANSHLAGFDKKIATAVFAKAGFNDIKFRNSHKDEDGLSEKTAWEMRILARKNAVSTE